MFLEMFRERLSRAQFGAAVINMTPEEVRHFQLIRRVFLNIEEIAGADSARLLEKGKKVEVEGLLRWAQEGSKLQSDIRTLLLSRSASM